MQERRDRASRRLRTYTPLPRVVAASLVAQTLQCRKLFSAARGVVFQGYVGVGDSAKRIGDGR